MSDTISADQVQYEHKMRLFEAQRNLFATHMAAICGFASAAINSIILANSAAAGAVLAMLGTMWGKDEIRAVMPDAVMSLKIFGVGIFGGMLCAACSYLAQFCYCQADMIDEKEKPSLQRRVFRIGLTFHGVALIAALVGIGGFACGAWHGVGALGHSTGGIAQP